ncbi:MAG: CCA tRNA nucleotidyltransferase [Planctomycetes bacterium]|nr:CCA tRNA nucleotidyltransferase [Planctomycetota bacterium]
MTNKEAAIKVIERLRENGFEALLAGGCVRDMLLERQAKDYDVATNAVPDEIIALFRRTLKIGAKFGVVMVLLDSQQVEVATFRTESGYADGRHPGHVAFSNAKEDAQRRDFTINGMFYDPIDEKVYDYVEGQADIERKVLRTIGDAADRFGEDYLRMLRAVRFSAQLGFEIEEMTWHGVCDGAKNITKISGERIGMEIEATLSCSLRGRGAELLCKSGLGVAVFSGFCGDNAVFGVKVVSNLPPEANFIVSLAGLFAGFESEFGIEKAKVLMLSNVQAGKLGFLLENRGVLLDGQMRLAELKMLLAGGYFDDLLLLEKGIQKAMGTISEGLDVIAARAKDLEGVDVAPAALLDGNEIMEMGVKAGPGLGTICHQMYLAQLDGDIANKQEARQWVRDWLNR